MPSEGLGSEVFLPCCPSMGFPVSGSGLPFRLLPSSLCLLLPIHEVWNVNSSYVGVLFSQHRKALADPSPAFLYRRHFIQHTDACGHVCFRVDWTVSHGQRSVPIHTAVTLSRDVSLAAEDMPL